MFKKVLAFRAFPFPDNGPGTRRFWSFCKYLTLYGHDVELLALRGVDVYKEDLNNDMTFCKVKTIFPNYNINKNSIYRKIQKYISNKIFPELYYYPDATREIYKQAKWLLVNKQFDCLLTTYMPMSSLMVADRLSREFKIPWVADLRDLPDQFGQNLISRRGARLLKKFLGSAAHVLTVSDPLKNDLLKKYNLMAPITVVYNGYEENDYENIPDPRVSKMFNITYSGNVYGGRSPELLFQGLDLLLERGVSLDNVRVCFYGPIARTSLSIDKYKSSYLAHFFGKIPHKDVLSACRASSILLSLSSPGSEGILTSKVFEYAAINRPVLSIPCDNDVLDEFISSSRIGVSCNSAASVAEFIDKYLSFWRESNSLPIVLSNAEYIHKFTRKEQAKKLSNIILSLK